MLGFCIAARRGGGDIVLLGYCFLVFGEWFREVSENAFWDGDVGGMWFWWVLVGNNGGMIRMRWYIGKKLFYF